MFKIIRDIFAVTLWSMVFCAFFSICFSIRLSSGAFAYDLNEQTSEASVSTIDIVKEIEKSMLFDRESQEKIDLYQGGKRKFRKDDYILKADADDAIEEGAAPSASAVDMVVFNPKGNFDVSEKQKLAYNSALIGQYEVAIELYKQALQLDPDSYYSKFSLAVVYQRIGQFRQAKVLYYQLLKSNPEKSDEIIGNLLAILIEESPRDAVYLLSRLTTQNPKSAYVLAQAAVAYDKLKNYDQAISLLQKATMLDSTNLGYKYNLAVIYDKSGNYEKALEYYSDIARNYSDNNIIATREQIQKRINALREKL